VSNKPNNFGRKGMLTAAALSYHRSSGEAPKVTAVGRGERAKDIQRIARRYGVPVKRNETLADKFADVSVSTRIPQDYYDEVARMLVELGIVD